MPEDVETGPGNGSPAGGDGGAGTPGGTAMPPAGQGEGPRPDEAPALPRRARIGLLGLASSGKTLFVVQGVTECRKLQGAPTRNWFHFEPADGQTREYVEQIRDYLEARVYPPATTAFRTLRFYCEKKYHLLKGRRGPGGRRPVGLWRHEPVVIEILDVGGEPIRSALVVGATETVPREIIEKVVSNLKACDAILFLVDPTGSGSSEQAARRLQDQLLAGVLQLLGRDAGGVRAAQVGRPIAIVYTKGDLRAIPPELPALEQGQAFPWHWSEERREDYLEEHRLRDYTVSAFPQLAVELDPETAACRFRSVGLFEVAAAPEEEVTEEDGSVRRAPKQGEPVDVERPLVWLLEQVRPRGSRVLTGVLDTLLHLPSHACQLGARLWRNRRKSRGASVGWLGALAARVRRTPLRTALVVAGGLLAAAGGYAWLGVFGALVWLALAGTALWIVQQVLGARRRFYALWDEAHRCRERGDVRGARTRLQQCLCYTVWLLTPSRRRVIAYLFEFEWEKALQGELEQLLAQRDWARLLPQLIGLAEDYQGVRKAERVLEGWTPRVARALSEGFELFCRSGCPASEEVLALLRRDADQLQATGDGLGPWTELAERTLAAAEIADIDAAVRSGAPGELSDAIEGYFALEAEWQADPAGEAGWMGPLLGLRREALLRRLVELATGPPLDAAREFLALARRHQVRLDIGPLCAAIEDLLNGRSLLRHGDPKEALACFLRAQDMDRAQRLAELLRQEIHRAEVCARMCFCQAMTVQRPDGTSVSVGPFYVDRHPVTRGAYLGFLERVAGAPERAAALRRKWRLDATTRGALLAIPATDVPFEDAQAFARHYGKRVPSEAEWEIAAGYDPKGKCWLQYPWGNEFDPRRLTEDGRHPKPNKSPVDCCNMVGHIWQWVESDTGAGAPGARGTPAGRALLKGGCLLAQNVEVAVRVSSRLEPSANQSLEWVGFRCILPAV